MPYATIADVSAFNPERGITASTVPNASQVAGYLRDTAAIIDSVLLEKGYQLPVDSPNVGGASSAWLALQQANAAGGFYRTEWAAQASDKRGEAEDMWQTALKMLRTSQLDIPIDQGESLPRGATGASPPFFTRDMVL